MGSHGYQAINRLYREGRLNARVRFSFSCFGSVIGMPCVQGNTVNALSGIGDDLLRIGGVGEEVLNLTAGIYADPEYAEILLYLAQTNGRLSIMPRRRPLNRRWSRPGRG